MKRLFTVVLTLVSLSGLAQTILWSENFTSESNGSTTGTADGDIGGTWSVISFPPNGAGSFSRQDILGARFNANGTGDGEGVWSSGVIDISGIEEVAISLDMIEALSSNAQDYLRAYYRINNGPEVLFGSIVGGGGLESTSNASVILSGNTVEIVIRGRENTPDINLFIVIIRTFLAFDNVELRAIRTLYSRQNGNWNNTSTWSYTPGGGSCGCTPTADNHVNISHLVTMTGSGDAVNVTIGGGGQLRYNGNHTLSIHRGGNINVTSTGTINRQTYTGANITFTWPSLTYNVVNDGTINIGDFNIPIVANVNFSGSGTTTIADDIVIDAAANVSFSGNGTYNIGDDFLVNSAANVNFNGVGSFSTNDDFTVGAAANIAFSGNGNYTIGDDLLVNAAATITNNKSGGNITISDDLNFNTDNARLNNNHVLIMADLVVNDNGDDGNIVTNGAGGTLTTGTITPNNGNLEINNYGTLNQSGVFTNNSIDTGSSFRNRSTGVWNWTSVGGTNDAQTATVLDCSEAGNTFNYGGGGNQTIFNTQYHHLTLSNSGTKATNVAIDANGNITILGSAVLNANNNSINVGGNWSAVNEASFTQGSSIITFDGSGSQALSVSGGEIFQRMTINKPAGGVILNNNLTITGGTGTDLTLTRGILYTSSSSLLIINDGVTTSGGNALSFVDGPIRKVGNDAFVFPTGKNGRWARIEITNLTGATTSSQFTAEYFDSPHANLTVDGSLAHVSHGEYWTLTRAVNSPGARVRLYWENSFSDITNLPDLTVARYTGTNWTNAGATNAGPPAGPGTSLSSAVSNFQAFTFGSLTGINPLPVELRYFKAALKNNEVELIWETASELNNDYFTIERAVNVEDFVDIGNVDGKGTSSLTQKYTFTDLNPLYGRSYYRLKQTDFDGTVSYSDISAIEYNGPEYPVLTVYPNPTSDNNVTLRLEGIREATEVLVTVSDLSGKVIHKMLVTVPEGAAWENEIKLNVTPGVYLITAGAELRLSRILIVK